MVDFNTLLRKSTRFLYEKLLFQPFNSPFVKIKAVFLYFIFEIIKRIKDESCRA